MNAAEPRPTVLVLTGYDLEAVPVVEWLTDRFDVLLIASRNAAGSRHGALARAVRACTDWAWIDDVFDNWRTVEQARLWHEKHHIDHVVCLDEFGLITAAHLRRILGVSSGQQLWSALAHRHKPTMYEAVADHVRVPAWRTAGSAFDVTEAVDELGFPVVVKPSDGAASVDTHILRDSAELATWLRDRPVSWPAPLIVQRCVTGAMYHLDGLSVDGTAYATTVSAYGAHPGGHRDDRHLTSMMLAADDPVATALREQLDRVVRALPPTGGSSFHAEFFVTDQGEVEFCEIASRTGGSGIRKAVQAATGVHLVRAHALLQCGLGLDDAAPGADTARQQRRTGWFIQYAAPGRLLAVPEHCDVQGVTDYRTTVPPGRVSTGTGSSIDAVQQFIVEAIDDDAFAETYRAISDWCDRHRLATP